MNLTQYVNDYKLELIKNRIIAGRKSIKGISEEFNFSDASYFTRYFKNHTGMTPSKFKKNNLPRNKEEGD